MNRDELASDLTPFADIGAGAVKISEQSGRLNVRLTREGRPLKIVIDLASEKIQGTWGTGQPRGFSNFASLLASEIFANLRRWSDAQQELLRQEAPSPGQLLPVHAITHDKIDINSIDEIDKLLGSAQRPPNATEVLLIDGPAGIGKTSLIEQLALRRAEAYKSKGHPLILHVKSRGRVLSNLQDLMAFSLQTIRSTITYDQMPVLAKHGLVVIAIDGFDELADPNGYEMAWAQLGDLVEFVRGQGTIILAGRDTFIGRTRLMEDVDVLREGIDVVNSLTLSAPTPTQAKEWLRRHQWTEANLSLPAISVLLEENSFALRPVFLKLIAEHVKPRDLRDKYERYLTPLLVNYMIHREAGLFGKPVQAVMDEAERVQFLSEFLREVARDMADSQTESIESAELGWISEAALGDGKPAEIVSLIRNRADVVAFFVNDERQGYKAFMHSYLLNYFVALVAISSIAIGEMPKFLRRNLLGAEFLSVFSDVVAETAATSPIQFYEFWSRASNLPFSYSNSDRGLRNVGALALAALPSVVSEETAVVREYQIDDAVIRGSCPKSNLSNITISQLDCRGADLSSVECSDVKVDTLIADGTLRVGASFPTPKKILLIDGQQIVGSSAVESWLGEHGRNPEETVTSGLASDALKKKTIYGLLRRAARMRQYWLREDSDDLLANKILSDPEWPKLSQILAKHDYLREEVRQASGRASSFYHVKHRENILMEAQDDQNLRHLFEALQEA